MRARLNPSFESRQRPRFRLRGVVSGLNLLGGLIVAASCAAAVADTGSVSGLVPIGTVIERGLSGLDSTRALEPERVRELEERAREFVRFRRGKLREAEQRAWAAQCFENRAADPFCDFATRRREPPTLGSSGDEGEGAWSAGLSPREAKRELRSEIARAEALLRRSDLRVEQLAGLSKRALLRALVGVMSWDRLRGLADQAMIAGVCAPPRVSAVLAQKAEEFFPDVQMRRVARELYSRALECAAQRPDEYRAESRPEWQDPFRFRIALLSIWEGQCAAAEPHLWLLNGRAGGDFVMRSTYWLAECALKTGDRRSRAKLDELLLTRYPLSYHGLALRRERPAQELARIAKASGGEGTEADDLSPQTSGVRLRLDGAAELNRLAELAEVVLLVGDSGLARELALTLADRSTKADSRFRLYVAVLLLRAGDFVGQFRQMAQVFQDDPRVLSRPILAAFYPLRKAEILTKYGDKVDPLLVAALIRQESAFNERALSPAGARGWMQLLFRTARLFERVSRNQLFQPDVNVRIGVRYFYRLLSRFGGDAELALAAYNAGPERVEQWRKRYVTADRMLFLDLIPFKETRDYVPLIGRNYFWYLGLYERETNVRGPVASFTALTQAVNPEASSERSQP